MSSESEPVYADLSRQNVQFPLDGNVVNGNGTLPMMYQPVPHDAYENPEQNLVLREEIYMDYQIPVAASGDIDLPYDGHQIIDGQRFHDGVRTAPLQQLAGPVGWGQPEEDLRAIFPKTYGYRVPVNAVNSAKHLHLSKWERERAFYADKLHHWSTVERSSKMPEKEVSQVQRLVNQFSWLLHNCWPGEDEAQAPPEDLWRVRKEEARRLEQLLSRRQLSKEIEEQSSMVKTNGAACSHGSSDAMLAGPSTRAGHELVEQRSPAQAHALTVKRKTLVTRFRSVGDGDFVIVGSDAGSSKKPRTQGSPKTAILKSPTSPAKQAQQKVSRSAAIDDAAKGKLTDEERKLKLAKYVQPLGLEMAQKSATFLALVILHKRWSEVRQKLHCELGRNAQLLGKDVDEFLEEIKMAGKEMPADLSFLYGKQKLLQRRMLDNSLSFYFVSWVLLYEEELSKSEQKRKSLSMQVGRDVIEDLLEQRTVIEALLALEVRRYGGEEIAVFETFAGKCLALKSPDVADAADELLELCKSYQSLIATPMPKTLGDARHAKKKEKLRSLVTTLLDFIEEITEQKDLGSKEDKPETAPPLAVLFSQKESQISPPKKSPKNVISNMETASEPLATSRPKRKSKPPNWFLVDNAETGKKRNANARPYRRGNVRKRKRRGRKPNKALPVEPTADMINMNLSQSSQQFQSIPKVEEFMAYNNEEDTATVAYGETEEMPDGEAQSEIAENEQEDTGLSPEDAIVFNEDVETVARYSKMVRDNGLNVEVSTYKAHFYNGVSQEVSEDAYNAWMERNKDMVLNKTDDSAENTAAAAGGKTKETSTKEPQAASYTGDQIGTSLTNSTGNGTEPAPSNRSVIKATAQVMRPQTSAFSRVEPRSQIGPPANIPDQPMNGSEINVSESGKLSEGSRRSTLMRNVIEQKDLGRLDSPDTGNQLIDPSADTFGNVSSSSSCGAASFLSGEIERTTAMLAVTHSVKSVKLKTPSDHIKKIKEQMALDVIEKNWLPIPEVGALATHLQQIKRLCVQTKFVLESTTATWDEYFAMKRRLELMSNTIIVENDRLMTADDDDIIYVPPNEQDIKPEPWLHQRK